MGRSRRDSRASSIIRAGFPAVRRASLKHQVTRPGPHSRRRRSSRRFAPGLIEAEATNELLRDSPTLPGEQRRGRIEAKAPILRLSARAFAPAAFRRSWEAGSPALSLPCRSRRPRRASLKHEHAPPRSQTRIPRPGGRPDSDPGVQRRRASFQEGRKVMYFPNALRRARRHSTIPSSRRVARSSKSRMPQQGTDRGQADRVAPYRPGEGECPIGFPVAAEHTEANLWPGAAGPPSARPGRRQRGGWRHAEWLPSSWRAPWKGAVSQRVRIPPGNCRSSRKQSERCKEATNCR